MTTRADRTSANQTRQDILRVSLDLFTQKGFAGTSVRDISQALGLAPSALYYHFASKDQIVKTLMQDRVAEVEQLVEWVREQPPGTHLLQAAAVKWVERTTPERVQGMRLAQANPETIAMLADSGADIRGPIEDLLSAVSGPAATPQDRLFVRLVFATMDATLLAARGTEATHNDLVAVARRAVIAMTRT